MQLTALITGASSGIGQQTAMALARQGYWVLMTGRNQERLAQVAEELTQEGCKVTVLVADLSSLSEVRRLASEVQKHTKHLDVLVNNAGLFVEKRQVNNEGYEMMWMVNHLAPFLLTELLLPLLESSEQGRIVNVSSDAHYGARIRWNDINFGQGFSGFASYGQSKLANILFTRELAHRLRHTSVTVNCLHPGVVATRIWNGQPPIISNILNAIAGYIMITPEQGAQTSIYLATAPELKQVSGLYFANKALKTPSALACDAAAAKRLWVLSEEMIAIAKQVN